MRLGSGRLKYSQVVVLRDMSSAQNICLPFPRRWEMMHEIGKEQMISLSSDVVISFRSRYRVPNCKVWAAVSTRLAGNEVADKAAYSHCDTSQEYHQNQCCEGIEMGSGYHRRTLTSAKSSFTMDFRSERPHEYPIISIDHPPSPLCFLPQCSIHVAVWNPPQTTHGSK